METGHGKFVPRSLYIDLEPTVIDEVRTATPCGSYSAWSTGSAPMASCSIPWAPTPTRPSSWRPDTGSSSRDLSTSTWNPP